MPPRRAEEAAAATADRHHRLKTTCACLRAWRRCARRTSAALSVEDPEATALAAAHRRDQLARTALTGWRTYVFGTKLPKVQMMRRATRRHGAVLLKKAMASWVAHWERRTEKRELRRWTERRWVWVWLDWRAREVGLCVDQSGWGRLGAPGRCRLIHNTLCGVQF